MAIVIFQHSQHGHAGRFGTTLRDHGFRLDYRRPDLFGADPKKGIPSDLDNLHGLIILGGPQMVTDAATTPWLAAEMALIKSAHERQLPIIGICLGAQMIAHALGGKVDWKEKPAIGMFPLGFNPSGQTEPLLSGIPWQHPQFLTCSQEVKTLPPGSTLLASAPGTPNALFKVGIRTLAMQFHPECDRPLLDALAAESKDELAKAGTTAADLTASFDRDYALYARAGDRMAVNLAAFCFPLMARNS